ncbi:MAG: crossover junction endodeoxyribonuclease RuvC [Deltaproteobacteria bacterium]|nr:crossover junction endodeoxyribonuclease RuvC [Deltaproteobacteria bacterium]
MIVIGIDPGTVRTGFGIVRRDGNRLTRLSSGTISTSSKKPMEERLLAIHEGLDQVLTVSGPEEAAVEDIFFSKNARSALKLGQVRGVILLTLTRREIPITSYAPALVKRAVVGSGRAAKEQVGRVVQAILGLDELPGEDEGDALAIAICHLNAPRIPAMKAPSVSKRPKQRRPGRTR